MIQRSHDTKGHTTKNFNGALGSTLIMPGLLLAAGAEASSDGAVCVAGAILIAGERVGGHLIRRGD